MVKLSEDPAETPDQTLLSLSGAKSDFTIDYGSLSNAFDRSPSALMLLPGSKARQILENEISGYMKTLSDLLGDDWSSDYKSPLNTSAFLPGSDEEMSALPMVINLYSLSLLESGILITESAAIKQLASK